jgi:uncharacterized protein YrrD
MEHTFKIGAPVFVDEGEAGRLQFVVVDPDDNTVTDLIVEQGRLLHRSVVVPTGWVESADEQSIRVHASLADLEDLPEYREVNFRAPDPTGERMAAYRPDEVRIWHYPGVPISGPRKPWLSWNVRLGVDDSEVVVGRGTKVSAAGGETIGNVDHVLVDPRTQSATHFVVRPRSVLHRDDEILIDVNQVASLSDKDIRLRITEDDLEDAPRYQRFASDDEVEQRVRRSLQTQPETRGHNFDVDVEQGVVRLVGEAPRAAAEAAAKLARRIRGVIGVDDRTRHHA